jgi:enoyl-CoA hydratase
MTEFTSILVEIIDRVGLIRLNRPKAYNALNKELLTELLEVLYRFDKDDSIGVIVITGSDKAFAAGADITEMADKTAVEISSLDTISIYDQVLDIDKQIIAAVSGFCLGGGCEFVMSCDMIFASETAVFGQPEINLGVIPGAGGTQRLTRAVGKALSMEMILNDRRINADEALQAGLVSRVFPLDTYLDETLKIATEISVRAPLALVAAKKMVNLAYEKALTKGLAEERQTFYDLFDTNDQSEGINAFLEKRKPEWKGK